MPWSTTPVVQSFLREPIWLPGLRSQRVPASSLLRSGSLARCARRRPRIVTNLCVASDPLALRERTAYAAARCIRTHAGAAPLARSTRWPGPIETELFLPDPPGSAARRNGGFSDHPHVAGSVAAGRSGCVDRVPFAEGACSPTVSGVDGGGSSAVVEAGAQIRLRASSQSR